MAEEEGKSPLGLSWRAWDAIRRGIAVVLFGTLFVVRFREYPMYYSKPLWIFETGIFLTLALLYVLRQPPRVRARGAAESVFPYFVSALPFALQFYPWSPCVTTVGTDNPLVPGVDLPVRFLGVTILMVTGYVITMLALGSLFRSFGITVEVRDLVRSGLYRWIRHPVYLGEIVCTLGVALLRLSAQSLVIEATFIGLQYIRALLEEQKLQAAYSDYGAYREQTGMFLPRLHRAP